MPTFTAYIDRDTNPRVRVTAATAAEARQYATGRYGKVLKIKLATGVPEPQVTPRTILDLELLWLGVTLRSIKVRKLRTLGLVDAAGELTDAGREALNTDQPETSHAR